MEVVKIEFNLEITSFNELLQMFWEIHDPTDQKNLDLNNIERSVIFYVDERQKTMAKEAIKTKGETDGKSITTSLSKLLNYTKADENQQKYYF